MTGEKRKVLPGPEPGSSGSEPEVLTNCTIDHTSNRGGFPYLNPIAGQGMKHKGQNKTTSTHTFHRNGDVTQM